MTAALLFGATFALVFTLGLQQLNVERGHQLAAFGTSFLIGGANLALFKVLPGPTGPLEITGYLCGGAIGIVGSMQAHPYLVVLFSRSSAEPATPADHAHRLGETLRLATELANDKARSDIQSCHSGKTNGQDWYDIHPRDSTDGRRAARAFRYLEICGQIIRHPVCPEFVRLKTGPEGRCRLPKG